MRARALYRIHDPGVSVEVEWRSPGRVVTGMKPYLCRLLMSSREGDNLSGEPR